MNRRLAHGRARPVPEDIAALDSLELRVIWEYLGHDPPLNCRRTLDQFGYPSLKDTYARDDDQMLYKLTKEEQPRGPSAYPSGDPEVLGSLAESYSFGTKLLHEIIDKEKDHVAVEESENEAEAGLRDGNLLMVDQLWLWAIDTSKPTHAGFRAGNASNRTQPPSRRSSQSASRVHPKEPCFSRRT